MSPTPRTARPPRITQFRTEGHLPQGSPRGEFCPPEAEPDRGLQVPPLPAVGARPVIEAAAAGVLREAGATAAP